MKKFLQITAILTVCMISFSSFAQINKFLKGTFEEETKTTITTADIDLYQKTVDGGCGNKCYGTIEVASEWHILTFDIVNAQINVPKPYIEVIPADFCDGKRDKVFIQVNSQNKTLTLLKWMGSEDLILRKK